MTTAFAISQSKVADWNLCKLKYHFRYQENLKPRMPARPLKFGSIAHELLEADARGKDMMGQLSDVAKREHKLLAREEEYGKIIDDMAYIMKAYKQFWSREPLQFTEVRVRSPRTKTRKTQKAVELLFEVPLTRDLVAKGRIDGIVHAKGYDWVLEHKTHREFPNADHRWRNLQSAVYLRIVEMAGWARPAGILWDYIRNKAPTRPRLLVSGKMSEAECDSLPEVIHDTALHYITQGHRLVELQLSGTVANLAERATNNLPAWFQRTYAPIQENVVRQLFIDFVATGREMRAYYTRHSDPPRRTIGRHCAWCAFEAICRAELQGNDVDLVRETQFVVDDSDYQTEIAE